MDDKILIISIPHLIMKHFIQTNCPIFKTNIHVEHKILQKFFNGGKAK